MSDSVWAKPFSKTRGRKNEPAARTAQTRAMRPYLTTTGLFFSLIKRTRAKRPMRGEKIKGEILWVAKRPPKERPSRAAVFKFGFLKRRKRAKRIRGKKTKAQVSPIAPRE